MAILRVFAITTVCNAFGQPSLDEWKAGKAAQRANASSKAADDAKSAAVNKVITMLEDLKNQVLADGEKEAAAYNKFACFCKDTTAEKNEQITKGNNDVTSYRTTINDLTTKRETLDETIATREEEIEDAEKAMKKAKAERDETFKLYEKNAADLTGALDALAGAIEVLKSSKKPALAQMKAVSRTVQTAAVLADALGLGGAKTQRVLAFFLQQDPSVPMEDYKFHSDSVIDTLETLQGDFRKTKQDLDQEEVQSVAEHDAFMQEKADVVRAKTLELEEAKKQRSQAIADIASNNEELSTTAADLLDNQQYLAEASKMCENRAKTWDQRSEARAGELTALTTAIDIVSSSVKEKTSSATVRLVQKGVSVSRAFAMARDPEALEQVEAEAEATDGSVGFLQRYVKRHQTPSKSDQGRAVVVALLKSRGAKLHSAVLTALASRIEADPFAKIKKLIQDLIERLLQEAANEANQKGWCDKALSDAKQKRDYATEEVAALNAEMAKLEATRDKLNEEIDVLATEIGDLYTSRNETTDIREQESANNEHTVLEAQAGLEAVKMAIDVLDKYYKTAAKNSVDLSLLQGPLDDAPDAGFDEGEAYKGAGGEAGGILGMLDVIKSDFERTVDSTVKAEAAAASDYRKFMTESSMSLAEKNMAHEQKTDQRDNAVTSLGEATESFDAEIVLLNNAVKQLMELQPTCIDTGMSYEERVARREDEIESLKKALCILIAYQEYGPDGLADAC